MERPTHRRRERSFLWMIFVSEMIVIAVFVAVVLWIMLRGMY